MTTTATLNTRVSWDADSTLRKIVRLGTVLVGRRHASVYCKIELRSNGELSVTGVEGPLPSGNCLGSCGQIDMHLKAEDVTPAPGWTRELIQRFLDVWGRWHLNGMRAGTPAQEEYLRAHPVTTVYPKSHYDEAGAALAAAGLNPDNGYEYGSAWLREDVPADVVKFLASLPDADKAPAWV